MIKITDLTEQKFRTVYRKDAYGNRIRHRVEYTAKRKVRTVKNGPRFGQFIIDGIFFQVLITAIQLVLSLVIIAVGVDSAAGKIIEFYVAISLLLLYPLMYLVCEQNWQQTPGKFLMKTIVIDEYGNKPSLRQVVLRSLIRLVPFEMFSCYDDTYSRGWHDEWSDTFVVTKDELENLKILLVEQEIEAEPSL